MLFIRANEKSLYLTLKKLTLILLFCTAAAFTKAQSTISIKDISKHIGETVTICDSVYITRALPNLTLINLGAEFPKQLLTMVIYKVGLGKFNKVELYLFLLARD